MIFSHILFSSWYHAYLEIHFSIAFNEVGGYEKMLDLYRYNATADPEYAAFSYDEKTGINTSCR